MTSGFEDPTPIFKEVEAPKHFDLNVSFVVLRFNCFLGSICCYCIGNVPPAPLAKI